MFTSPAFFTLLSAICTSALPQSQPLQWRSSVDLEGLRLSWTPRTDQIVFQVEAVTQGWLGVGFSPDGSLAGADLVIGWVDDHSQKAFLLDYHGTSATAAPQLDPVQNYELLEGVQNATHTTLRFQRAWDTCDYLHDRILGNNTERIVWAVYKEDPQDLGQGALIWSENMWQGPRSVHLISVANPRLAGINVKHWDVVLTNFTVPDNMDTMYWCKIFKAPSMSQKHHIIGYEPLVSSSSLGLVHHMILYECAGTSHLEQFSTRPGSPCDSTSLPQTCVTPSLAWALSSVGEFLPDHVGIPIGEPERTRFFMLEVHYDNPTLKRITDSSGLRVYYTDRLRQHEGATVMTGITISPLQVIPPGQTAYKTAGYCDFHCTDSTLSPGINVISAVLHTHKAGQQITLRHVRSGVELTPIAQDKTYDFNYQQSRVLVEERQILPGDEIITECTYNTAGRSHPTVGGYSTKQEMCIGFLTYYPRAPLASCLSMTPVEFFFQTFGVKKFYHYDMPMIEKMFLRLVDNQIVKKTTSTTPPTFLKLSQNDEFNEKINEEAISTLRKMPDFSIQDGDDSNLFDNLFIEEPEEFRNRSFTSHLQKIPWSEELLTQRIEATVYKGKHMTFCRLYNDSLQTEPQIFSFPNFTELSSSSPNTGCPKQEDISSSRTSNVNRASPTQEFTRFTMMCLTVCFVVLR